MSKISSSIGLMDTNVWIDNVYAFRLEALTDTMDLAWATNLNQAVNLFNGKFFGQRWFGLSSPLVAGQARFELLILAADLAAGADVVYVSIVPDATLDNTYTIEIGAGTLDNVAMAVVPYFAAKSPNLTRDGNWHNLMWFLDTTTTYQSSLIYLDSQQLGPLTFTGDNTLMPPYTVGNILLFTQGSPQGLYFGQHTAFLDTTMEASEFSTIHTRMNSPATPRFFGRSGPFYNGRTPVTFVTPSDNVLVERADVQIPNHKDYEIVGNLNYSKTSAHVVAGGPLV